MTLRFDFTGRSVAVTGGAAGISAAVVEFFAGAGADVTVADIVEPAAAKAPAKETAARPPTPDSTTPGNWR
jgi:NAD(P)-dependent dehydrogenase (short-subunit alcohol dehydrogenase family)